MYVYVWSVYVYVRECHAVRWDVKSFELTAKEYLFNYKNSNLLVMDNNTEILSPIVLNHNLH